MIVPEQLRPPIAECLATLVRGDRPDLLTWVRQYGNGGATLVPQPDALWTHSQTTVTETHDGGWHLALPLWTTEEGPSDLSAEVTVAPDGTAAVQAVHVL